MEGKFILLIQSDPTLKSVLYRGLVATGSYVMSLENEQEISAAMKGCHFDLVFADMRRKDIIENVHNLFPDTKIVVLSDIGPKDVLPYMAEREYINNLVAVRSIRKFVDVKELIVSTEKLLRNDIFGLDKYLRWGGRIYKESITTQANAGRCIERVTNFAGKLNIKSRICDVVTDVTDELLQLAFLQKDTKKQFGNGTFPVDFSYSFDGESLFVATKDYVGELDKSKVLTYFNQCFGGQSEKVVVDDRAGFSVFKIFRAASHFGINHEAGKSTEIIVSINLEFNVKELKMLNKSFHYFKI